MKISVSAKAYPVLLDFITYLTVQGPDPAPRLRWEILQSSHDPGPS